MTPFRFIGDADTALGFRLAGVPGDIVTTREDALEAFSQALSDRNLVVLVMTEQVAQLISEQVTAHKLTASKPYVATVEDVWGHRGKTPCMDCCAIAARTVRVVEQK